MFANRRPHVQRPPCAQLATDLVLSLYHSCSLSFAIPTGVMCRPVLRRVQVAQEPSIARGPATKKKYMSIYIVEHDLCLFVIYSNTCHPYHISFLSHNKAVKFKGLALLPNSHLLIYA